uniref:Uncharacterized protein n=1 Tax=Magallana gigas TaxID=29159 RepID=A0A8W8NVP9_MAGGI
MYRTKFKKKERFICECCDFSTDRFNNYKRHCETKKHRDCLDLTNHEETLSVSDIYQDQRSQADVGLTSSDSTDYAIDSDGPSCCDYIEDHSVTSDSDETKGNNSKQMQHEVLDDDDDEEIDTRITNDQESEPSDWFPFESKLHFLLSVLHSSKTHRVSDETLSFILYILRECCVKNVPSLAKIKSFWTENLKLDEMIQQNTEENGNIHWMVKPSAMLQMLIANPSTAQKIDRYPNILKIGTDKITTQSSAEKWKEVKFHWGKSKTMDFILGEIIEFSHKEKTLLGKIRQFMVKECDQENGELCVEVEELRKGDHPYFEDLFNEEENRCLVIMNKSLCVPIDKCSKYTVSQPIDVYLREVNDGYENFNLLSEEEKRDFFATSSLWKGKPIIEIPLKSRRWAPLHGIQAQLAGLPLEEKNKNKNSIFLAASEQVAMMELLKPVCDDIKMCAEIGVDSYDAFLKQEITLTSEISSIISDYQMMSLVSNHMGPAAIKFCPKCLADKSDPFTIWPLRTSSATRKTLRRLEIHAQGSARTMIQKQTGIKFYDNCLWQHVDPHRDAPVGILHFLYLGLAKHLIQHCVRTLSEHQMQLLTLHLETVDQTDFSYRINADTFFKFLDSRQGKDYKHYLQVAPFNMEFAGLKMPYVEALGKLALISKHIYQGVTSVGSEFEDYLAFIKDNIPQLGSKSKTHFCVHISDDIIRHGHPLHFTEDVFEKNHKSIRESIRHQNGHQRSRDTVIQFAKSELTKHVVSGGFLHLNDTWKQASSFVLSYGNDKKIKSFLGVPDQNENFKAGELRNVTRTSSRKPMGNPNLLEELELLTISVAIDTDIAKDAKLYSCLGCITSEGDYAGIQSFVLYSETVKDRIGVIQKLLRIKTKTAEHEIAFLKVCNISFTSCNQVVQLTNETHIKKTCHIRHVVHVIHDCKRGGCRVVENHNEKSLKHSNHNGYIINRFRISKLPDKLQL